MCDATIKQTARLGGVYFSLIMSKTFFNGHSIIKNAQPAVIVAPVKPNASSKGFIIIIANIPKNATAIELTLITVPRSVDFMRS